MTHEVEDARAVLDRVAPSIENQGFPVRTVVGRGEPADDTAPGQLDFAQMVASASPGRKAMPV